MLNAARLALENARYRVSRLPGRSKLYQIERATERLTVAIRTSSDRWIGFSHDDPAAEGGWRTLGRPDVDAIVIAAVDDPANPEKIVTYPPVPRIEMLARFNAHFQARVAAGQNMSDTRNFVALDQVTTAMVSGTGSGIIEELQPLGEMPIPSVFRLRLLRGDTAASEIGSPSGSPPTPPASADDEPGRSTLLEAKQRLADELHLPLSALELTLTVRV
jgi:hypothetical protein